MQSKPSTHYILVAKALSNSIMLLYLYNSAIGRALLVQYNSVITFDRERP